MTAREQLNDLDWEGMFSFVDRIEGAAQRDADEAYATGLTRGWFYGVGSVVALLMLLALIAAIVRWMT